MLTRMLIVWALILVAARAVYDWLSVYWIHILLIGLMLFCMLLFVGMLNDHSGPHYVQPNQSTDPFVLL